MLTETRTNGATQLYKYEWSYDDAGNREWQKKWTTVDTWDSYVDYTYNSANQLTDEDKYTDAAMGIPVSYTDYTYDDAGNMTDKDIDMDADLDIDIWWDYTYNYENRQTKVEKDTGGGSAEVGEYVYNVLDNRVQSEVEQTTTLKMFYDGDNCVGDYDGTTTRWYVTPMLDQNLMLNNGSDYFYTQDGLGSVRELIDTNQTTQNSYDYEAFGSFYGTPAENVDNHYTYTGREWDSESGTYYYRARYYHPTLGIFGGRDPVESINLYTYARNNPVIFGDATGAAAATLEDILWPCIADPPLGEKCEAKEVKVVEQKRVQPKGNNPLAVRVRFRIKGENLEKCKLQQKVWVEMVFSKGGVGSKKWSGVQAGRWMQKQYVESKPPKQWILGVKEFRVGEWMPDWVKKKFNIDLAQGRRVDEETVEIPRKKSGYDGWMISLPGPRAILYHWSEARRKYGKPRAGQRQYWGAERTFGAVAMHVRTYVVDKGDNSEKCRTNSYYYYKTWGVRWRGAGFSLNNPTTWVPTVRNADNVEINSARVKRTGWEAAGDMKPSYN